MPITGNCHIYVMLMQHSTKGATLTSLNWQINEDYLYQANYKINTITICVLCFFLME